MDISEADQAKEDQRSIRFGRFHDYTVLEMSGNYFASYSDELVDKNARAKQTLNDVVLPMMKAAVPRFVNDDTFDGFAIEVSQHVRHKVLGLPSENAENLLFYFPRAAAQHLAKAETPDQLQAAVLDSKVFVNADPINLWITGDAPPDPKEPVADWPAPRPVASVAAVEPTVSQKFIRPVSPARIITPKDLTDLNAKYSDTIKGLERSIRADAHLSSFVPTQFVGFHEGAYLQLSVQYKATAADRSRYYLAATAFDDFISHLVRPTLAHFQDTPDFDGVVYSAVIQPAGDGTPIAVEFFLPLSVMRSYASYDATGQDLIDSGFVLINGERSTLKLQVAEAMPH